MAVPRVSDDPIVQQHYAAQLVLAAAMTRAARNLSTDPPGRYLQSLSALTQEFSRAGVSLAADYYTELRDAAGVPGTFTLPVVDPWDEKSIEAYVAAATKDIQSEVDRFVEDQQAEIASMIALNAGTREIFAAIDADPKRVRWARVTRPGACAFCLMLATRGARYRTEKTASFRPHVKCQCDVEPSWTSYEAPAHIRAAESLWADSTHEVRGGRAKLNAFRRALYAERNQASR